MHKHVCPVAQTAVVDLVKDPVLEGSLTRSTTVLPVELAGEQLAEARCGTSRFAAICYLDGASAAGLACMSVASPFSAASI
jgi:hypothetical protein